MHYDQIVADYLSHGWALVPIPPGGKGPRLGGWNQRGATLLNASDLPPAYGVGLAHAYSGTMALDVDDWTLTKGYGIDVDALYAAPDSVIIHSGKQGHGKLLYRMPFGLVLPSKKVTVERKTAFELRCGTVEGLTVQDVLPPSTHPETKQPYQWAGYGHWTRLPVIPTPLLVLWRDLIKRDEDFKVSVDGVDASWDEVKSALHTISPDCSRDEWIQVGMALHYTGVHTMHEGEAFGLWDEWSRGSQRGKYPGDREMGHQWRSFKVDKGTPVTLGTLYHIARQHGWVRPTPDASTLFSSVEAMNPTDLAQSLRPAPPELDLSLWPPILKARAEEVSESVGCDPIVPLFAGLAAACGVIDARIRLELMPGFQVPPVLWLMTIGDPADKKSPGSRPMMSALKALEIEDRPRWKKATLDWEIQEAAFSAKKKDFLAFAGTPEASLSNTVVPELPELPPEPIPLKITVSDITSQKLVRQAADRPRGLLCYLDEMNSWCRKMTDKTSGEDRSAWVVGYESERYEMDRVGAGSVHADNFAVSIYGNIQPRIFRESLEHLAADGLLQRFIPGVLRQSKTRLGNPIPDYMTSAEKWENTLRLVYALPPMVYKLSPESYQVYREFQRWYEALKQDERLLNAGDTYMTAFGKLEGLVGRLCLMFHAIENPFAPTVDATLVRRVIRLVQTYIIPAFRYTLGEIGGVNTFDAWVTDHIIHYCDRSTITMSEIRRSARRQLENIRAHEGNQMVLNAMWNLEQANWVARVDDGTKEHQGQAEWMINPALKDVFKEHRHRVIQAKQRARDVSASIAGLPVPARVHGADDLE